MKKGKILNTRYLSLIFLLLVPFRIFGDDAISDLINKKNSRISSPDKTECSIIIDNKSARFKGNWQTSSASKDRYKTGYHYHKAGRGANYAQYSPAIKNSGLYDIFEWHPEGENRTSFAELVIKHSRGKNTVNVNQKINGGQWNFIARVHLSSNENCHVRITDKFKGKKDEVVIADAIRFDPVFKTTSEPAPQKPTPPKSASKKIKPFAEYVKAAINDLERKKKPGISGYLMKDKWGKYTGVTETISYRGKSYMWNEYKAGESERFSKTGKKYYPHGKSYCSGLTLEIWHNAMKKRDRDMGIKEKDENWNGLGTKGIFIFKKIWNVINLKYKDTGKRISSTPSPARALEMSGLGKIITRGDSSKFKNVRPYDFCDISRSDRSGHSVIFIKWIKSKKSGVIIGFKYYSTQKRTKGQGYNTEYFKGYGGKVLKSLFNAGRAYDNPKSFTGNRIREAGYK
jgi:hypothetical protein